MLSASGVIVREMNVQLLNFKNIKNKVIVTLRDSAMQDLLLYAIQFTLRIIVNF